MSSSILISSNTTKASKFEMAVVMASAQKTIIINSCCRSTVILWNRLQRIRSNFRSALKMSTHWFCFYFQEREKKVFFRKVFFSNKQQSFKMELEKQIDRQQLFLSEDFCRQKNLDFILQQIFFWQNLFFWTTFEHLHGQFSVQNFSVSSRSH